MSGPILQIQADYGREMLMNLYGDKKLPGGRPIFNLLVGIYGYIQGNWKKETDLDQNINVWFHTLEHLNNEPLRDTYSVLVDHLWGTQDGPLEDYSERDFAAWLRRYPRDIEGRDHTEEDFKRAITYARAAWQPIDEVLDAVRRLLDLLKSPQLKDLDGFFVAEHSIPDFEALLENLMLLKSRDNEMVRLNFMS